MKYNKLLLLLLLLSGCSSYQYHDIEHNKEFKRIIFYVPKSYSANSEEKIKLNALIHKAKNKKERIGLLVVNYGGPGGEAVNTTYDIIIGNYFPESILERFDILAIDPRGTGKSEFSNEIIKCNFNENCNEDNHSINEYISTTKFVKDIDYIRNSLHENQITFLGYSYGTKIGQLYSFLYPSHTRGMILDSPVSIEHSNAIEESMTIPLAYERIIAYRLNSQEVSILNKFNDKIKKNGYFLTDDGYKINQEKFNELLEFIVIAELEKWDYIKPLISDFIITGKADMLFFEIVKLNYEHNINLGENSEALIPINCTDERKPLLNLDNSLPLYENKSILFGALAERDYAFICYDWRAKRDPIPSISKINNTVPILIISGYLDNLTPYEEAIKVKKLYTGQTKLIRINNLVDHSFSFLNKNYDVDSIAEGYLINPNSIVNK